MAQCAVNTKRKKATVVSRSPEENEKIVRTGFADKARRTIGKIPFTQEAIASYYCAIDPATPTRAKVTIMAALAYFVLPIDFLPDFILMLGFIDDASVFWAAWRSIRGHVNETHRARAQEFLGLSERNNLDNP